MKIQLAPLKYNHPLTPFKADLEGVEYIILHHIAATTATPEQIHSWHKNRGWNGAGYNEYIRKDGTVHILRGDHIGAQCHGYNSKSYGIAVEGNYDKEEFMPLKQMQALAKRVAFHERRLPDFKAIKLHKELNPTTCPGKNFPVKFLELVTDHWAEPVYNELHESFGLTIHEKRFNDPVTRGEAMALLLEGLKSIKEYVDHH